MSITGSYWAIWALPIVNVILNSETDHSYLHRLPNRLDCSPSSSSAKLWVVFIEHLQRIRHTSRQNLPFQTPGVVPVWDKCVFLMFKPLFSYLSAFFNDFCSWISLNTSSISLSFKTTRRKVYCENTIITNLTMGLLFSLGFWLRVHVL